MMALLYQRSSIGMAALTQQLDHCGASPSVRGGLQTLQNSENLIQELGETPWVFQEIRDRAEEVPEQGRSLAGSATVPPAQPACLRRAAPKLRARPRAPGGRVNAAQWSV